METLDKIQDLELTAFTFGDIENVNGKLGRQIKINRLNRFKFNPWNYFLSLLNIKTHTEIFLDENIINSTWEKVILNQYKHEQQSEKSTNSKESTKNGIQSYLRKVGI